MDRPCIVRRLGFSSRGDRIVTASRRQQPPPRIGVVVCSRSSSGNPEGTRAVLTRGGQPGFTNREERNVTPFRRQEPLPRYRALLCLLSALDRLSSAASSARPEGLC